MEAGKKNRFKPVILIITLLFPLLIYFFLRGFGENHYSVPVFYQKGISPDSTDCSYQTGLHLVDFSMLSSQTCHGSVSEIVSDKLSIIYLFNDHEGKNTESEKLKFQRLCDLIEDYPGVQIITLSEAGGSREIPGLDDYPCHDIKLSASRDELIHFLKCELILLDAIQNGEIRSSRIVLIDDKRRIRGYYEKNDFEEIDRLMLEIKIILKEEFDEGET